MFRVRKPKEKNCCTGTSCGKTERHRPDDSENVIPGGGFSAEKGNDIPNNREARKQPPDQRKGNRQFNCSPDQCSERKRIISGAVHGIVATVIAAVIAAVVAVAVAGMFFVAVHFSPCPFRNIE